MLFNHLVDGRSNGASQASFSISSVNNDADLIGALARTDRGNHRVIAAIAAIATIAIETSPSVETDEGAP